MTRTMNKTSQKSKLRVFDGGVVLQVLLPVLDGLLDGLHRALGKSHLPEVLCFEKHQRLEVDSLLTENWDKFLQSKARKC